MKAIFLFLLFVTQGWNKIGCGIAEMQFSSVKAPHKLNTSKPRTVKIYAFSNHGQFQIGIVPRMPLSREEALEMLHQSECSSVNFVTSIDDLTCEMETGEHYFILVTPKEDGADKIAYEIYSPSER